MRDPILVGVVVSVLSIACSSARPHGTESGAAPFRAAPVRSECRDTEESPVENWATLAESDTELAGGEPTLLNLDVLRRTVVQVNDNYVDAQRIDPPRMLSTMVERLAKRSDGFLRIESRSVVASDGSRFELPNPSSVWQIPLAVRSLGVFVRAHVPEQHAINRGAFAETIMTNALLSTLDRYSVYLPPGLFANFRRVAPSGSAVAGARFADPGTPFHAADALRRVDGGVLYIGTNLFLGDSAAQMRSAIEKLQGTKPSGVVLDLRGNRGGLLDACIQVADLFLASGRIATLNGRRFADPKNATDDGLATERLKLVVLVDSATSSGAEIIAGALRFNERAILLGETTAGNGFVQVMYEYKKANSSTPSGLKLSIAEALLPGDRGFEGGGVAPDLEVTKRTQPMRHCTPVGEEFATIHLQPDDPDRIPGIAAEILRRAPSASRADLLDAAKAVATDVANRSVASSAIAPGGYKPNG